MGSLPWLGEWAQPQMVTGCLRPLFLQMVSELAPEVLETLRDDVLSVYRASCDRPNASQGSASGPTTQSRRSHAAPSNAADAQLPRSYHTVDYQADPTVERPLFTEQEAAQLYAQGYQLLSDSNETEPLMYHLWEPRGSRPQPLYFADLQYHASLADLRIALLSWADRFRLQEDWVMDVALAQLDQWHRHFHLCYPFCRWPKEKNARPTSSPATWPERINQELRQAHAAKRPGKKIVGPQRLEWLSLPAFAWFSPVREDERRLTFTHPGWDPATHTRAAAKNQMLTDFRRSLEQYLDRLEARLSQDRQQWQPTPAPSALVEHMQWLVRQVCLGESINSIALAAYRTRQTVSEAVHELAQLVELKIHPHKGGRPRRVDDRRLRHRSS